MPTHTFPSGRKRFRLSWAGQVRRLRKLSVRQTPSESMPLFNHFISSLANPLVMGIVLASAAAVSAWRGRKPTGGRARAWAVGLAAASAVWFWFWCTPLAAWLLSCSFEGAYPAVPAEAAPGAEAIVILGGGISCDLNGAFPYPDLQPAADRIWHGIRLYRAGKAPRIIATGKDTTLSTRPILLDFGVPPGDFVCIDGTRNTEEESRHVAALLRPGTRILLVTSASHMRRAELLFRHAGLDVLPAATDHETGIRCADGFAANWFWPDPNILGVTCRLFKEHYAGWAYRHIRGFRPAPTPPTPPEGERPVP